MTSSTGPGRRPAFLGIGAQKAGTTWLHHVLMQHPDLCLPHSKETHFFETPEVFEKGPQWYTSLFSHAEPHQLCGEVTPGYLWTAPPEEQWKLPWHNSHRADIPTRVRDVLGPDIKLIVILRNPVDRAVSAFVHHASKGRIDVVNEDPLKVFRRFGIVHIGFYANHIEHWFRTFPRDRFHFYCLEQAKADKPSFYRSVFDVLGVRPLETVSAEQPFQFAARYRRSEGGVVIEQVPEKNRVYFSEGSTLLRPDDIAVLQTYYRDDVMRLQDLTGLDLSSWRGDFPDL